MKNTCILLLLLGWFSFPGRAQSNISIETVATGLLRPTKITNAHDGRLFVSEIGGKIKIIKNDVVLPTPFLDISDKMNDPTWAGIYSIAFHPNYQANGYFYVMYVVKDEPNERKFEVQISRFSRTGAEDSDLASPVESPILNIKYTDVLGGHKGGDLSFGPDNMLYISTGDNGPGSRGVIGDPNMNAQNDTNLYGKILKIDPDNPPTTANAVNNIWAKGLRNPWRFSFDRSTGDFWLGDNGQDGWEEVDFLPAGSLPADRNFGWSFMEGDAVYKDCFCNTTTSFAAPVFSYAGFDNNGGQSTSVIGGYVYRGSQYPSLRGTYFFADYQNFQIGTINQGGYKGFVPGLSFPSPVSFGEDQNGEIYILSITEGTVGKIIYLNDPLPVRISHFRATQEACMVQLHWNSYDEVNFAGFQVERSPDGRHYVEVGNVKSLGGSQSYDWLDATPPSQKNYYRLKMVDLDGTHQYSSMIEGSTNCSTLRYHPYPNPVEEDVMTIPGLLPGDGVELYASDGTMVFRKIVPSENPEKVYLNKNTPGIYILKVLESKTGNMHTVQIVQQ